MEIRDLDDYLDILEGRDLEDFDVLEGPDSGLDFGVLEARSFRPSFDFDFDFDF